jgi:hypothetical protein
VSTAREMLETVSAPLMSEPPSLDESEADLERALAELETEQFAEFVAPEPPIAVVTTIPQAVKMRQDAPAHHHQVEGEAVEAVAVSI